MKLAAQAFTSCWLICLAHRPHPPGEVARLRVGSRRAWLCLHPVDVVWVDQKRLLELPGGSRELRQHQRPVLLRNRQVTYSLATRFIPSAEWRDHHDVRRPVESGHLLAGKRRVEVVDRGMTHPAEVAVDPADQPLDVVAKPR